MTQTVLIEQIKERNMAGKVITNTYKGILRISNNIDLKEGIRDSFLNDEYYLSKESVGSTDWTGNGTQSTYDFLFENGQTKRFKSSDKYVNLKIPVTDSMGNYLNFSLGVESSLIGSNEKINNKYFNPDSSILVSNNNIILGKSKQDNEIIGATLNITSSSDSNAKLIVLNKKRHSGTGLAIIPEDTNVRTVYELNKAIPQKYDIFLYEKDNFVTYENENKKYKDCKIILKNLKDYIYSKIGAELQKNKFSVPTGTIISQYCNLDKWYCLDEGKSNSTNAEITKLKFDDVDKWQGYRPAMINASNNSYSNYNVLQGKFLKTKSYLYYDKDETSEMPPDFKRGYALCDGSPLTIYLRPYWDEFAINEKKSLELLLDLFYIIGYHYQKDGLNLKIHRCVADTNNEKYHYHNDINSLHIYSGAKRDVCYGIAMATILAFKELNSKFSLEEEAFGNVSNADKLTKCLEWLSKQAIPNRYIFNILNADNHDSYYTYNGIKINIGRKISSFNDEIPYYSYDPNKGEYKLVECKIINTAEVRDIAMLFINKAIKQSNWDRYNFTFYLPKLFTTTDTEVNDAYRYNGSNKNISIGQFIGSNGTLIVDKLDVPHLGQTFIPNEGAMSFNCLYRHSYGYNAHNHALGMGKISFDGSSHSGEGFTEDETLNYCFYEPAEINPSGSRMDTLKRPKITNNRISPNINPSNVIATDYHHAFNKFLAKSAFKDYDMNNYIFQDVLDATSDENISYSMGTGSVGYELLNSDPNFKWYGRSSEPLWAEHNISSNTKKYDKCVGYFTPESIKVMPLIKL